MIETTGKQQIRDFCKRHGACREGREWALATCADLAEVWATARPAWLLWVATRPGVLTDRELRLFACWCVHRVWHLLEDPRSRTAVEVAARHALGEATDTELGAAADAADAAWFAADAAWFAADAAWFAADAAWFAADAAWFAAAGAADAAQAAWLRAHMTPNFDLRET